MGASLKRLTLLGCTLICILIVVIYFFVGNECVNAKTVSDGDYQIIFDDTGNEITRLQIKGKTGTIYLHGKHARATTTINYRTFGFNFTLKDSGGDPRGLGVDNYKYIERSNDDGGGNNPFQPDEDFVVDTYRLDGEQVIDAMITLMKNQKKDDGSKMYKSNIEINAELANGVTVYMSNAFKVIEKTGEGTDDYIERGKLCHSCKDILQEVWNQFGVGWSENTKNVLPYYYDNPIKFQLISYKYNVVYIDQEDYENGKTGKDSILSTPAKDLKTYPGSESGFVIEDPANIDIKGTAYENAGKSYYKYNDSNTFYNATLKDGVISAKHQYQSDATLYVLVKNKGNIDVVVKYVDKDGKVLKDNINGGKLSKGKAYTHNLETHSQKVEQHMHTLENLVTHGIQRPVIKKKHIVLLETHRNLRLMMLKIRQRYI